MIVCVKCQLQYRTVKTGSAVEVMTQDNQPYQLFAGDRLECPECGHVIVRTALNPIVERHHATYNTLAARYRNSKALDRAWTTRKEKDNACASS